MGKDSDARRERLRGQTGPGPTAYMLPPTVGFKDHDSSRRRNPAYSMGLMLAGKKWGTSRSPGPIYAIPKGQTARGPECGPKYSVSGRYKPVEFTTTTPGPAAYYPNINCNRNKAPSYLLAWRTKLMERGNASPGPIYMLPTCLGPKIPDKMAAGQASIKSRGMPVEKMSHSPGPIYDIGRPDIIKNKGGEVTLKSRWRDLKSQSINAGPGTYNVDKASKQVYRHAPVYSLGIRHSEFSGTFLTECDKSETGGANDDC